MAAKDSLAALKALKSKVSSKSVAGKLRDRTKSVDDALKSMGAKANTGRKTTRNA